MIGLYTNNIKKLREGDPEILKLIQKDEEKKYFKNIWLVGHLFSWLE